MMRLAAFLITFCVISPVWALTCKTDGSGGCVETAAVAADCASLGFKKEDVAGCNHYLYCPFDQNYKACVAKEDTPSTDPVDKCADYTLDRCPSGGSCIPCTNGSVTKYKYIGCQTASTTCNIGDIVYSDRRCSSTWLECKPEEPVGIVYASGKYVTFPVNKSWGGASYDALTTSGFKTTKTAALADKSGSSNMYSILSKAENKCTNPIPFNLGNSSWSCSTKTTINGNQGYYYACPKCTASDATINMYNNRWYPNAARHCLSAGGYFPALGELKEIANNATIINKQLVALSKDPIPTKVFSSTEYNTVMQGAYVWGMAFADTRYSYVNSDGNAVTENASVGEPIIMEKISRAGVMCIKSL